MNTRDMVKRKKQ